MKYIILTQLTLVLTIGIGWVVNIIALVNLGLDQALSIEGALRIIGIPIFPLDAVLGYFI